MVPPVSVAVNRVETATDCPDCTLAGMAVTVMEAGAVAPVMAMVSLIDW